MDIPFVRAKVGDRYVIEQMSQNQWLLGGETSGHIICSDVTTTGDGIIAALQVLHALSHSSGNLHQLKQGWRKLPQTMVNVRLTSQRDVLQEQSVVTALASAEERLAGRGRVLLRPSGTEPLIRVMVEGESVDLVQNLAKDLADVVSQAVG